MAWVQAERKQEQEAKAGACCPAQVQRDSSHGGGRERLLAAVGGAALQEPCSGGKCLFNQEIDRRVGPHSSLGGLQGGWGRAWHANNARSFVSFRSASSTSIRTQSRHNSKPQLLPSLLFCFRAHPYLFYCWMVMHSLWEGILPAPGRLRIQLRV